ncbi:transcriptional regulator TbsP [Haloplanus sp. GCM10025708]|uniref:transcriptional regulator TbsP n=1 Tax=Haloferacaceae TaxID=1644056 RepID=UPI003617DC38
MTIDSNRHAADVRGLVDELFEASTDGLFVVNPTAEVVEGVTDVATEFGDESPSVRILADGSLLKSVLDDFLVASNAADLVASDVLDLRTPDGDAENALVLTDETVLALVSAGDRVAALADDDPDFVAAVEETYETAWDDADPYNLRTPPLSRVRETLAEEIGEATRDDFDAVLSSLDAVRGDGDGIDEVTLCLLVAAKNDVLLYDISKWGEDVGIASKATFSRTKTRLEDRGLVDTEKVPIDVGRPRLRLKLGDDRLRGADADELAAVATSLLA